jgi:hypothetical protein
VNMDTLIGKIRFVDGSYRDIFQQPDGRPYVVDDGGEPIHGVWIIPEEKCVWPDAVVERHCRANKKDRT